MSDERATQVIKMTPARVVDVSLWLFVGSSNPLQNASAQVRVWNNDIRFCSQPQPDAAGAIFVSEENYSISKHAGELLHYFFRRDGAGATVFEYDKFEGNYKARRWEQIAARIG